MNVSSFDWQRVMDALKHEHGIPARSKKWGSEYKQIPIAQRVEFLRIFVRAVKNAGKPEEWFTNTKREEIVKELIPYEKAVTKEVYASFKGSTLKDLRAAIAEVYAEPKQPKEPTEEEVEFQEPVEKPVSKEFDPSKKPKVERIYDPRIDKFLGFDDE